MLFILFTPLHIYACDEGEFQALWENDFTLAYASVRDCELDTLSGGTLYIVFGEILFGGYDLDGLDDSDERYTTSIKYLHAAGLKGHTAALHYLEFLYRRGDDRVGIPINEPLADCLRYVAYNLGSSSARVEQCFSEFSEITE